jgi:SulP family sulfate permease
MAGDILGGISSAVVSVPTNIIFGIIAFSPLGSEYISYGIRAGFYSAIFVGLFAALLGGSPGMISGPKATITLILSSVTAQLLVSSRLAPNQPGLITTVITIALLVVFLSGVIQVFFGVFRFGSLIKFIPYPVIAGFLNGSAVLIILSQVWNFFGIPQKESFFDFLSSMPETQLLTVSVGIVTVVMVWIVPKFIKKVPGSVIGLLVGSFLYYVLVFFGYGSRLGPTIGQIALEIPKPLYLKNFWELLKGQELVALLPSILPASFGIAVLGSTESLLTSLSMQNLTNRRSNTNRELVGQGIGNIIASCFGGIAGAGSIGRSTVSFQAGGRTRLSGTVNGIALFLIIFFLSSLVSRIPIVVTAGIVIVIAFQMIDIWSLQLFKNIILDKSTRRKDLLGNFIIILLVTFVTIFLNLIIAVGIGVVVSILMFVAKMSRRVIRRKYSGASIHSKRRRDENSMELLLQHGHKIAVLELDGSIFFSTGVRILQQAYDRLIRHGKFLAVSYLEKEGSLWQFMAAMGFFNQTGKQFIFSDTDLALEYFEDQLLFTYSAEIYHDKEISMEELTVFQGLRQNELQILSRYLNREQYDKGKEIFRQGDKGDALFFITQGLADITIDLPGTARKKRLQTLSSGTFFGEMALLDGKPRSANVVARDYLVCYRLTLENFNQLQKDNPKISITLLTNISRTIATRLRLTNDMILELEL